ncbi:MAG: membrane fusion protein MtrC, partial [Planctomycetes bacterium]|nr:membrane fusion protein MtrC [Planctomycetota bacterium]
GTRAAAPPSGDSLTHTGDLWYGVHVEAGALRPGQPVFVPVPLAGATTHLVVPWSAILRDERGRAFVYEVDDKGFAYTRRAVDVLFVYEGEAAITGKIATGAPVVIAGVPELWGIESGHAR